MWIGEEQRLSIHVDERTDLPKLKVLLDVSAITDGKLFVLIANYCHSMIVSGMVV